MIAAACIAVVVALWLFVGLRYAAPQYITRAIQEKIEEHQQVQATRQRHAMSPLPQPTAAQFRDWRREAVMDSLGAALCCPVYLPLIGVLEWLERTAPSAPLEAQARMEELERRNAELERQLGVGAGRRSKAPHYCCDGDGDSRLT